jgi:hypothetical protein
MMSLLLSSLSSYYEVVPLARTHSSQRLLPHACLTKVRTYTISAIFCEQQQYNLHSRQGTCEQRRPFEESADRFCDQRGRKYAEPDV